MAAAEWSERTRMWVTVGVVLLINAGCWTVTYLARSKCQELRVKLKKLDAQIADLKKMVDEKEKLEGTLKSLQMAFDKEAKRLPGQPKRDDLSEKVTNLAQNLKMKEKSRRSEINKKPEIPGLNVQNFESDVLRTQWEATYSALGQFVNQLEEHYDYIVAIEGLSISDKDNGMGVTGALHDVTLDIVSYRYLRPAGGL